MSSKVLVIIASADREKILTALMYARNTIAYKWLDDVKVMFFGPSEKLLAEDAEIAAEASAIADVGEAIACKFLSDRDGTSKTISDLRVNVEYVGTIIADLLKDGYTPMVW